MTVKCTCCWCYPHPPQFIVIYRQCLSWNQRNGLTNYERYKDMHISVCFGTLSSNTKWWLGSNEPCHQIGVRVLIKLEKIFQKMSVWMSEGNTQLSVAFYRTQLSITPISPPHSALSSSSSHPALYHTQLSVVHYHTQLSITPIFPSHPALSSSSSHSDLHHPSHPVLSNFPSHPALSSSPSHLSLHHTRFSWRSSPSHTVLHHTQLVSVSYNLNHLSITHWALSISQSHPALPHTQLSITPSPQ